jgi:hypothetical protein
VGANGTARGRHPESLVRGIPQCPMPIIPERRLRAPFPEGHLAVLTRVRRPRRSRDGSDRGEGWDGLS